MKMNAMIDKHPRGAQLICTFCSFAILLSCFGFLFECLEFAVAVFDHSMPLLLRPAKGTANTIAKGMDCTTLPIAVIRFDMRQLILIGLLFLVIALIVSHDVIYSVLFMFATMQSVKVFLFLASV